MSESWILFGQLCNYWPLHFNHECSRVCCKNRSRHKVRYKSTSIAQLQKWNSQYLNRLLRLNVWQTLLVLAIRMVLHLPLSVAQTLESTVGYQDLQFCICWHSVYLDSNTNCNTLNFQLGNTGQGAAIANRGVVNKSKKQSLNVFLRLLSRSPNTPATIQTWHLKAAPNISLDQMQVLSKVSTTIMAVDSIWQIRTKIFASGKNRQYAVVENASFLGEKEISAEFVTLQLNPQILQYPDPPRPKGFSRALSAVHTWLLW